MATYIAAGRVVGGKLIVHGRRSFDEAIYRWRDCPVTITIERSHATRSKAQNDYYHAVVVARIADAWKKDPKETHEILKAVHLPHDLARDGRNGSLMSGYVIGGSTTRLNKLQFIEYLESIVGWAAESLKLYIPDPDPKWRELAEQEHAA